ncbi:hypothetical protein HN011_003497 [Eciton burchellii]|nr:hypothetical protein HN011_003497 [Eciton burchellii]
MRGSNTCAELRRSMEIRDEMRKFTGERETIGALGFVTHVVYEMRNLETFMERGSSAITNLGFVKSICGLLGSVDARDSESPRHFAKCTQPLERIRSKIRASAAMRLTIDASNLKST